MGTPSALTSQQHPMSACRIPQGMFDGQEGFLMSGEVLSDINILLLGPKSSSH